MGLFSTEPRGLYISIQEIPVAMTGLTLLANSFEDQEGWSQGVDLYMGNKHCTTDAALDVFEKMARANFHGKASTTLEKINTYVETVGADAPLMINDPEEMKVLFVAVELAVEGLNRERNNNPKSADRMWTATELGKRIRVKLKKAFNFDTGVM